MPAVRKMLEEVSGKKPDTGVNPVTAVALGAATYAYMLEAGNAPKTIHQKESVEQPTPAAPLPMRLHERNPVPPLPTAETTPQPRVTAEPARPLRAASAEIELTTEATPPPRPAPKPAPVPPPTPVQTPAAPVAGPEPAPALPEVRFVTAHGVGIRVRSGESHRNVVLIPKNTQVPASKSRRFFTASETTDATFIRVSIMQGDTPDIDLAESLGVGKIEGFPRNEPAGQPVDVHMEFDKQGRLHLRAVYVNTGQAIQLSLEIPGGLTTEQVREHHEYLRDSGFLRVFKPGGASGPGK